jgi:hypothetical protein
MTRKLAAVMILLLALALGAGCSAPGESGGSPAPRTQPVQQGTTGDISPGPVVTLPSGYGVEIQVNKNMITTNPYIDVFYRGGKGQIFLQKMVVQVQKSDGTIETGELVRPEGGQISVGDKVRFMGTTGTDRVIVTVTIPALGREFKVHDQLYEFKTRP